MIEETCASMSIYTYIYGLSFDAQFTREKWKGLKKRVRVYAGRSYKREHVQKSL